MTLAQSVLASIPIFHMRVEPLPTWVHKAIDMAVRCCVWGKEAGKRGVHLGDWDTLCKPKHLGGVNLKANRDMNQAMLAKLAWRVLGC